MDIKDLALQIRDFEWLQQLINIENEENVLAEIKNMCELTKSSGIAIGEAIKEYAEGIKHMGEFE
jgi:hypothetical protein